MRSKLIRLLLLCLLVCPALMGYSQQKTIRGVLTDANNAPIAGASVTVKGTTRGTTTDATGNYSVLASPNDVLVISAVGFETKEMTVGTSTSLNLQLSQATADLGGVVVTALG